MLPKNYRLKKRSAFTATYKTGKAFHYKGITLFCGKPKTEGFTTKIGFVVSKKIHKRAVKRNKIKRRMREIVRLLIKNNNFDSKCMSLIFVANSKTLNMSYNDIESNIKQLFEIQG